MAHYRITGAHESNGKFVVKDVQAHDEDEARRIMSEQGILVNTLNLYKTGYRNLSVIAGLILFTLAVAIPPWTVTRNRAHFYTGAVTSSSETMRYGLLFDPPAGDSVHINFGVWLVELIVIPGLATVCFLLLPE